MVVMSREKTLLDKKIEFLQRYYIIDLNYDDADGCTKPWRIEFHFKGGGKSKSFYGKTIEEVINSAYFYRNIDV